MHYYQHNIGDYARDTGHLSVLEHGIYRLLIDWCYLNEKPITTEQAMRVGRGNPTETQSVLSEFFSQNSDGWTHKRVVAEIDGYHAKAKRNRENGSKGGRPKPMNNPLGSQSDAKHNPNQEPITINQEPNRESAIAAQSLPTPPAEKQNKPKTLTAYLEGCKAAKLKPIPDGHSLRTWAAEAGITTEMLQIAWVQFRERYTEGEKGKGKRYKDWPAHFATAIKNNWFKLWFAGDSGMQWSSVGLTHKTVLDARMAQKDVGHE